MNHVGRHCHVKVIAEPRPPLRHLLKTQLLGAHPTSYSCARTTVFLSLNIGNRKMAKPNIPSRVNSVWILPQLNSEHCLRKVQNSVSTQPTHRKTHNSVSDFDSHSSVTTWTSCANTRPQGSCRLANPRRCDGDVRLVSVAGFLSEQ